MKADPTVVGGLTRHWTLFVGLALTLVTLVVLPRPVGVYWTSAQVILVPPNSAKLGNAYSVNSENTVFFAAAIEREFNGYSSHQKPSSPSVPIYGMGVRDGYWVTLPNDGGQWQPTFDRGALDIQVVGPTVARVDDLVQIVIARLQHIALARQAEFGVKDGDAISISLVPASPSIIHVSGSRSRELLAVGIFGVALSCMVATLWDRRMSRRGG